MRYLVFTRLVLSINLGIQLLIIRIPIASFLSFSHVISLLKKVSFSVYIQPIGSVFTILGLLLVGPSSYVPELDWIQLPNHYVSIGGLSLMGIGTAALLVLFKLKSPFEKLHEDVFFRLLLLLELKRRLLKIRMSVQMTLIPSFPEFGPRVLLLEIS